MRELIGQNLRRLRKEAKLSALALADLTGTTDQQIYHLEHGRRTLTRDWAERLAPHLGVSPVELLFPELRRPPALDVPIFGYAGAREVVDVLEDGQHTAMDHLQPPSLADGYAAVIVRGESMRPVYNPGDVLLFRPPSVHPWQLEELNGRDCIAITERGRAYIKRIRPGREPGLVDLVSYNPSVEPLYDVRLQWAAPIEWVKRK